MDFYRARVNVNLQFVFALRGCIFRRKEIGNSEKAKPIPNTVISKETVADLTVRFRLSSERSLIRVFMNSFFRFELKRDAALSRATPFTWLSEKKRGKLEGN